MVTDDGTFPSTQLYAEWLQSQRGFEYTVDKSLSYRELVSDFLRQKRVASGNKEFVGATVHHSFHRLPFIWPDARFIHLIRDPRDVARSVVQRDWAGNLYHASEWWIEAEGCWAQLSGQLPAGRAIELHYEQLVTNPEEELTRLCEFIGVGFDSQMLEYDRDIRQYPKPDARLAFQWKTKLAPRDVAIVEKRTGSLLEQRGYELSGHPWPVIGPLKHELLMLQSRAVGVRARTAQLGLPLVALDMIGRRLRLESVAKYAQRRINAVHAELIAQEAAGKRAPSANIPIAERRDSHHSR